MGGDRQTKKRSHSCAGSGEVKLRSIGILSDTHGLLRPPVLEALRGMRPHYPCRRYRRSSHIERAAKTLRRSSPCVVTSIKGGGRRGFRKLRSSKWIVSDLCSAQSRQARFGSTAGRLSGGDSGALSSSINRDKERGPALQSGGRRSPTISAPGNRWALDAVARRAQSEYHRYRRWGDVPIRSAGRIVRVALSRFAP